MSQDSHGADAGRSRPPPRVVEDLLADRRCRAVLQRLVAADGPVLVEDLARAVEASRSQRSPTAVTPAERRRWQDRLFESTLPRLTATRLVAYDSQLNTIELRDDEIADSLE